MEIQQDSLYVIGYGNAAAAELIELRQDGTVGAVMPVRFTYSHSSNLYPFTWGGSLYILSLALNSVFVYKMNNHNTRLIAGTLIDTDDYETVHGHNKLGTIVYHYIYGNMKRCIQVDAAGRLCILSSHNITYISMHTFDYSTTPRLGKPSEHESLRPSWYDCVTDTHYDIERKTMAERMVVRDVGMGVKHILLGYGKNHLIRYPYSIDSVFVCRDRLSALYSRTQNAEVETYSLGSLMPLDTLKYDSSAIDAYYVNEYVILSICIQPGTSIIHANYRNLVDNTEYTMSWHISAIDAAIIAIAH